MDKQGDFANLVAQFLNESHQESSEEDSAENDLVKHQSNSIKIKGHKKTVKNQREESLKLKQSKGKLIEIEKMEVGRVNKKVYWEYIKALKVSMYVIVFISYLISHSFNFAAQLWLSEWSNDSNDPKNSNNTELRNKRMF